MSFCAVTNGSQLVTPSHTQGEHNYALCISLPSTSTTVTTTSEVGMLKCSSSLARPVHVNLNTRHIAHVRIMYIHVREAEWVHHLQYMFVVSHTHTHTHIHTHTHCKCNLVGTYSRECPQTSLCKCTGETTQQSKVTPVLLKKTQCAGLASTTTVHICTCVCVCVCMLGHYTLPYKV